MDRTDNLPLAVRNFAGFADGRTDLPLAVRDFAGFRGWESLNLLYLYDVFERDLSTPCGRSR